jgi:hypothetical protein
LTAAIANVNVTDQQYTWFIDPKDSYPLPIYGFSMTNQGDPVHFQFSNPFNISISNSSNGRNSEPSKAGPIAGGVVGSLVLVAAGAIGVWLYRRRRANRIKEQSIEDANRPVVDVKPKDEPWDKPELDATAAEEAYLKKTIFELETEREPAELDSTPCASPLAAKRVEMDASTPIQGLAELKAAIDEMDKLEKEFMSPIEGKAELPQGLEPDYFSPIGGKAELPVGARKPETDFVSPIEKEAEQPSALEQEPSEMEGSVTIAKKG